MFAYKIIYCPPVDVGPAGLEWRGAGRDDFRRNSFHCDEMRWKDLINGNVGCDVGVREHSA